MQKNFSLALNSDHCGPIRNTVIAGLILIMATEKTITAGGKVFLTHLRIPGLENDTDKDR